MNRNAVVRYIILALICLGLVQSQNLFVHAQSSQVSQSASSGSDNSQVGAGEPTVPNNITNYEAFFEWLASEHGIDVGPGRRLQAYPTIDYSAAIGISSDKVQTMTSLVLDAYRRRAENNKKFEQADDAFREAKRNGTVENLGLTRPNGQAVVTANYKIFWKTWLRVREMFGEEDFAKLNAFVDREFKSTPYPVSFYHPPPVHRVPIPVNTMYEDFFRHVAFEDRRIQRAIQRGDTRNAQRIEIYDIPDDKEEAVLAIAREGNKAMTDIDQRIQDVYMQFRRKYGPGYPLVKPYPPDIQAWDDQIKALAQERNDDIERIKDRMKEELGEDSFNKFDASLRYHHRNGMTVAGPANGEPNAAHQ